MQFNIQFTPRTSIFLPYRTHKHSYHLLFNRVVRKGQLLSVLDSEITTQTFFKIGSVLEGVELGGDPTTGERCGFIFHSTLPVECHGSSIISYSRQWAKAVNDKRFPLIPFGVSLVLRGGDFHLYHKKNQVSLAVSPNIALRIRENLEV